MPGDPAITGREKAEEIFARRQHALARREKVIAARSQKVQLSIQVSAAGQAGPITTLQTSGFLLAAGDSWFDYPFYDVLKLLDDNYGYNVESSAHRGDPIESMAYQGGQLDKLARGLEKILQRGAIPKAVLLSGGGDDIAGDEFGMLLNNATSPIAGWNSDVLTGVINDRIRIAYQSMLHAIDGICQKYRIATPPIVVHGYDYPVPDGRGFLGGWFVLPGPWLQPGFHEKYFNDLAANIGLMKQIIDQFNQMVSQVASSVPNVHYLDLRGTLSNALANDAYKKWWGNELHPTEVGFGAVTDKFENLLSTFP